MASIAKIDDQLRSAITSAIDSGWSLYALSQQSGVPYTTLHQFTKGRIVDGQKRTRPLMGENMVLLAQFFQMTLTSPKIPKVIPARNSSRD